MEGKVIPIQSIKICEGAEVQLHPFLNLNFYGLEWITSRSVRFSSGESWRLFVSSAWLNTGKGKNFSSAEYRNKIPRTSTLKYSRYTDTQSRLLQWRDADELFRYTLRASVKWLHYIYLFFRPVSDDTLSMWEHRKSSGTMIMHWIGYEWRKTLPNLRYSVDIWLEFFWRFANRAYQYIYLSN